jgi:hypothetical protein
MDTLFPTTIINYIGAFASAFAANNFIYFRGFVLGFLLLGQTRKCVQTSLELASLWTGMSPVGSDSCLSISGTSMM